ncbi:MAG: YicC/YloC family endoribonuclease [Melioribacteraceae bacterium]|nr:YicC/YloC family endoribonuclease [Melioribacteraceae bacterium]
MLNSMTGFGKSVLKNNGFSVETEIKSVNSRYLDVSLRLPRAFYQYEFDFREQVKKKIARGKLYISVSAKNDGIDDSLGQLNEVALKTTLAALEKIREVSGVKDEIKLDHLLNFSEIFMENSEDSQEDQYKLISESIDSALNSLEEMRGKEGTELGIDLTKRLESIEQSISSIEELSRNSIEDYFEKLKERAIQLSSDLIDNQDRLIQELALLSEKYDVTEECVRLRSHIKLFKESMEINEPSGRKLNFISQEMNREANTINSKTVSTQISAHGISIKEELEKIREQLQNIE